MNRRTFVKSLAAATLAGGALAARTGPARRPNILWITAEDLSPLPGCWGNPDAVTPNLDRFATESVRFSRVFSVHPCCSPSRSCLVTGVYPTRLGTFQHRGKIAGVPGDVRCFPALLREAGYYTFNGSRGGSFKEDYNFAPKERLWDATQSKEIEWRKRRPGQPFFGQINLACTHQSQYGLAAPEAPRPAGGHDPAKIHVPPYHPDTPAVRAIWADYHDRITQMDGEFGALLKMLEEDGLAGETVVFFFGDNGHGIPGGKVWLWDEGLHVPLIVRLPGPWAAAAPVGAGGTLPRLVSFLDFAPTVLTLAGVAAPAAMQGAPFLGPRAGGRRYCHAARDFHDGADFDTSRAVRDERYHYIRNFMPQQGWDAIFYSWGRAPHMLEQWRREAEAGRLKADTRQACFFRRTKPAEELYDTAADPEQMRNVAGAPEQRAALERLRAECERWMIENRDLGLLAQYEFYRRAQEDCPMAMGADGRRNPVARLLAAANLANRCDPAAIPELVKLMRDEDGAVRRWGAIGLLALREKGAPATAALIEALKDAAPDVRLTAAEALCGLGREKEALVVFIESLAHESRIIRNETLLALMRVGEPARAALPHLDKALGPSQDAGLWSSDNIPQAIQVLRACLGVEVKPAEGQAAAKKRAKGKSQGKKKAGAGAATESAGFNLSGSRKKYLP